MIVSRIGRGAYVVAGRTLSLCGFEIRRGRLFESWP